jgi:hypothetical protein
MSDNSKYAGEDLKRLLDIFCSVDSTKEERKIQYNETYNKFIDYIREQAWKRVFEKSNIDKYMTQKVKKDFSDFQKSSLSGQFALKNIQKFCNNVFLNREKILTESIVESFDLMTKYHKENRVHIEGWKTDKAWKVGNKVILPYIVEFSSWSGSFCTYNSFGRDTVNDIDKGLCMLAGKDFNSIVTILDGLHRAFKEKSENIADSEFFSIRYYKKGTIHLTFKDLDLLERFNLTVAKIRNWIPENFK